jgi:hypothetical protein
MAVTVDCYERGNILIYFGISKNTSRYLHIKEQEKV